MAVAAPLLLCGCGYLRLRLRSDCCVAWARAAICRLRGCLLRLCGYGCAAAVMWLWLRLWGCVAAAVRRSGCATAHCGRGAAAVRLWLWLCGWVATGAGFAEHVSNQFASAKTLKQEIEWLS